MTEWLALAPALAIGVLLGAIYFGGLWWTVSRGLSSPQPALWFLGSLLLRTAIALTGFRLVGGDDWRRWVVCLLGFVLGRAAVQWRTRDTTSSAASRAPEGRHAP